MKSYSMDETRKNLTDIVSQVAYGGERIAIRRRNKELAVLVPLADAELLEHLEDLEDIQEAKKALKERGPNLKWEDVKKELGLRRSRRRGAPG